MRIENAQWDGRPCDAHTGTVIVSSVCQPGWWCFPLVGKRIECLRVVQDGGSARFLLNDKGQGVEKVLGGGGFTLAHKDIAAKDYTFEEH